MASQRLRSMLDVNDTPTTPNRHQDYAYQQQPQLHQRIPISDENPSPRPPNNDVPDSGLSANTYALFRPQTPVQTETNYTQDMTNQKSTAQVNVDQIPAQQSETHVSGKVAQQYPKNHVTRKESLASSGHVHTKVALVPTAGAPTYDNTAASDPTLKDRTDVIVTSATETAKVIVSDTAAQVDTKLKAMANLTVQDITEQVRENFSTDSHKIARKNYSVQGAVQQNQGIPVNGVRDIGWHRPPTEIPDPLIGGLPNGRLFSMIRRFNKDVFDVRAVDLEVSRGLDLNDAWSDEHAADKITLNLQRMYLSIILGVVSFRNHVARLRSWKETRRTSAFCALYFTAWSSNLLMPLVLGSLILLVSSKKARNTLFPPAPLALVNMRTGGIQKPQAGQLGTSNTLTGAPEKQEGEAVEEEAANFVDNIRHMVGRAIGMHEKEQNDGDPLEGKIPNPIRNAARAIKSAGSAPGHTGNDKDLTQKPMEEILWEKVNPKQIEPIINTIPHIIGEIVDNWERFANAISPTPPFHKMTFLRINALLAPAFLISLWVNYYMVYKGIGFAIGFGIFGQPILAPSLHWLNRNYPNWMELLEPKNNVLRGIPTNSQLTLTLLRIGEANHAPLPPVPTSHPDDPNEKQVINPDDVPLDATDAEIQHAIHPSGIMEKSHPQPEEENEGPKHKKLSKFIRVLKGNTKASVETKMAADHIRAQVGNEKAKGHLGVLPKKKNLTYAGPSEYKARYDGKKGWLYITDMSILFSHKEQGDRSSVVVEIPFADIKRLKRATAFSVKAAEVAADWGSDRELLGSVEIDGLNDKTWRFTALPERDELFNRLVAIGGHRWENL
ncbi:Proteasome subunit beta type protein [Rutstroemia sp. NJR-2017a BBW]|nr:Proteasome subunit beta type protein [Rutstroemia sp. NJR-2017a BBW]